MNILVYKKKILTFGLFSVVTFNNNNNNRNSNEINKNQPKIKQKYQCFCFGLDHGLILFCR